MASSLRTYRGLVAEPGFLDYFAQATPIDEIELMPIASRPSRRHGERTLQDLRAIPWVFAWTQSRHLIPAWYGTGSAFHEFAEKRKNGWRVLENMYREWPFFHGVLDNAALALAKTDLGTARIYSALAEDESVPNRIWHLIEKEYDRSRSAVLRVTNLNELLDDVPWLQHSIRVRNPNLDPLNLLQVEWLRRFRKRQAAGGKNLEGLHELLRLTIQGIASGMRNTG
jgi:phosphoenolpyruvate carboxylase